MPTESSSILKEACSLELQVCLSMYDLLVDTRHQRFNIWTFLYSSYQSHCYQKSTIFRNWLNLTWMYTHLRFLLTTYCIVIFLLLKTSLIVLQMKCLIFSKCYIFKNLIKAYCFKPTWWFWSKAKSGNHYVDTCFYVNNFI